MTEAQINAVAFAITEDLKEEGLSYVEMLPIAHRLVEKVHNLIN